MKTLKKLKIADVVIDLKSRFPLQEPSKKKEKGELLFLRQDNVPERFRNFFYRGGEKAEITITVNVVDKLPHIAGAQVVFITNHFQDGKENWRLLKKGNEYIYKSPLESKQQVMIVNSAFNRVKAYLLPKDGKRYVWSVEDIIYDFLQVLLIHYFALNKTGLFVHSIGVKDVDGRGLLFAGKSGAGKSTTARLWHKHTKAMVLNDDRVIVRKKRGKFFIHGSPWHGDFNDYLETRIESAPLRRLFFIYHAPGNSVRKIGRREAFQHLYPALFPAFWDKTCLENIASMSEELVKEAPCSRLGFVNDKKVIGFVRKI
ncbi:MAG: hypothetical protein JW847_02500 [Candidatus Omnitrophica bacterium]|nr:hypothetical protein [Candidatus Omnitrophota bacterium]